MQLVAFKAQPSGPPPAPTVSSVAPTSGVTTGGTALTITGTNFIAGATVTLGGTPATSLTVVNSTTITATTPAHAAGAATVVVTNPDAQSGSLPNAFTYIAPAPTVTSVAPTSGPVAGGTPITITGTNFAAGAAVTLGGAAATGVTVVTSTTITATTPAHAAGAVTVTVTNADTQSGSRPNGFTYIGPAPTVASVAPPSGSTAGGTAITVTGTNFVAGATVTIGGTAATSVTVLTSTTITATTPAHASGAVTVVVTNPDAQSGSLPSGFTYVAPAPTVTSVAPTSGPIAGGTAITITGTGFTAGATVTLGGTSATTVTVVTGTTLTATTPAHAAGSVTVVVTNADAQSGSLPAGFTYLAPAPTVTSVAPASGPVAGGTPITITGTGFAAGATITLGGAAATGVTVVTSTTITATTPAHAAGVVTVAVTNTDAQSGSLPTAFTYQGPAPTVTGIAPATGPTTGGTSVTITGTNFAAGAAVTVGGGAATGVTVVTGTTITATTPAHAVGAATVVVVNADAQSGSLPNGFTYVAAAPTVTSVAPSSGPIAGGTAITITGTGFTAGATVTLGGTAATGVTVLTSTSITATTPAHAAGAVSVVVTNPDAQSGSRPNGFTYLAPAPTVTSVAPSSGPDTGGTSLTITGSNFAAGATVTLGGAAATGVTVNTSTSITATTPAHVAGAVSVAVTNADAQSGSLPSGYTYTTSGPAMISFVQVKSAVPSSGSSVAVPFTAAQTAGNLNVVVVGWNDTTRTVTNVTDSRGNTYVRAVGPTAVSGALSQSIYYAKNIVGAAAGANTVTVQFSGSAYYPDIRILEYSGLDLTNPLDVTAAATGSTATSTAAPSRPPTPTTCWSAPTWWRRAPPARAPDSRAGSSRCRTAISPKTRW